MIARTRWEREIGWEYINELKDAEYEIDPADYPPALEWEAPVWELFRRICTQWRIGHNGIHIGLDYNPAIALMQHWGWDIDLGLELLQVVELERMKPIEE